MKLVVVADPSLIRMAGRLVDVLGRIHEVSLLPEAEYERLDGGVEDADGVLMLGNTPRASALFARTPARFDQIDIRWGFSGVRAAVQVFASKGRHDLLDETEKAIVKVQFVGKRALGDRMGAPLTSPWTGPQLSGAFLQPGFVEGETVQQQEVRFSLERMLWERQYTIGIADFLARGFDEWVEGLGG